MRSLAIFSYLLISSSIYLGETPIGITVKEVAEYNEILHTNQLFIEYDIDNEVFNTSNVTKMNDQITIGGDFVLLNALILMEINEKVYSEAEVNMKMSSSELMDKFYNEEYYDSFEGAIISGNAIFLTNLLRQSDVSLVANVLSNYSTFFNFKQGSDVASTLKTITTTPSRLSLFLKRLNEDDLPFCSSSMTYIKNLITNRDEDFKSQEIYIVNESKSQSTYINIGYINGINEHAIKMFVEIQNSSKLKKIDNIRKDNYIVMNSTNEHNELGFFGE